MVNMGVLIYIYAWIGMLQMFFCWVMFFYASPKIMYLVQNDIDPEEYTKNEDTYDREGMSVYYWTLVWGQIGAAVSTTTKTQSLFFGKTPYLLPNTTLNVMFIGELALGLLAIYW